MEITRNRTKYKIRQHFISYLYEYYPEIYKVTRRDYKDVGCNATYIVFETSVLESLNGGQINLSTLSIKLNIRENSNKVNCTPNRRVLSLEASTT